MRTAGKPTNFKADPQFIRLSITSHERLSPPAAGTIHQDTKCQTLVTALIENPIFFCLTLPLSARLLLPLLLLSLCSLSFSFHPPSIYLSFICPLLPFIPLFCCEPLIHDRPNSNNRCECVPLCHLPILHTTLHRHTDKLCEDLFCY